MFYDNLFVLSSRVKQSEKNQYLIDILYLFHVLTGKSSWMPYAPQGVKGPDDDDDDTYFSVIQLCA
jgi:hypothetical protein